MSKKRTEFGKILVEKWNAICRTVAKENEIYLDAFHMTSAFDCVYFSLWSVPKIAPYDIVNYVKIGVYNIITDRYPQLKSELLRDNWYPIYKQYNYSRMENIAYFYRFNLKYSSKVLQHELDGRKISDIVAEGISNAVDNYNKSNDEPIDLLMFRCPEPFCVELALGCPITVSASSAIGRIKGSSSHYLRKNYPEFSDSQSPCFIKNNAFWAPSNFFAISRRQVESISRDKNRYLELKRKWTEAQKESDRNKKGEMLEHFMVDIVKTMDSFEIVKGKDGHHDINIGFEQIDLVLKNKSKILEKFGPIFKVECKNWKDSVGNDVIRDFSSKLRGDIRLGILISVNGFGRYEKKLIERLFFNDRKLLVTISGKEIDEWINGIIIGFDKGAPERSNLELELENKIFNTYIQLT